MSWWPVIAIAAAAALVGFVGLVIVVDEWWRNRRRDRALEQQYADSRGAAGDGVERLRRRS